MALDVAAPPADAQSVRQVADLFAAIADELQELNTLALSVQGVLGIALAHLSQDTSIHRAAQSLDLITQRLDGLGVFMSTIGTDVPADWQLDCAVAAERIKLANLARRLMGTKSALAETEEGAIEYF